MAMARRKLQFSLHAEGAGFTLLSEKEYSMPEEGWNLDSYIDLIDKLEEELHCYLFEQQSKNMLTFNIQFSNVEQRNKKQKIEALKKVMESIVTFFERMERLGVML